jgi:predicted S18 family serine protease
MKSKPQSGWVQKEFTVPPVTLKPQDTRSELQKLRDELHQAENKATHEKMMNSPMMKKIVAETGLTGDQLYTLDDAFKGEEYTDAVRAVSHEVQNGTSFEDAVRIWKNAVKPDREGETHGSTK